MFSKILTFGAIVGLSVAFTACSRPIFKVTELTPEANHKKSKGKSYFSKGVYMISKIIKLGLLCGVSLFFVACGSKASMFVDFDKVVDSKDFKEIVGDEVKFDFGIGSKEKIISHTKSSGSAKIGRYNDYFSNSLSGKSYTFSEIDIACGYALLDNLVSLKEYAKKLGGAKVVNIISYYKRNEQRDSKDSFLCLVGKSRVDVKLKADIAQ